MTGEHHPHLHQWQIADDGSPILCPKAVLKSAARWMSVRNAAEKWRAVSFHVLKAKTSSKVWLPNERTQPRSNVSAFVIEFVRLHADRWPLMHTSWQRQNILKSGLSSMVRVYCPL